MVHSRRTLGITAAVLALLLVAAAEIYARISGRAEPGDDSMSNSDGERSPSAGADVAIPVEGAPVVRGALVVSVTAAGQAQAWRRNTLVAQVGGQVVRLPARESQVVGAG